VADRWQDVTTKVISEKQNSNVGWAKPSGPITQVSASGTIGLGNHLTLRMALKPMAAELTTQSDFLTILTEATAIWRGETRTRPTAEKVVQALLDAEKIAKQQRLTHPLPRLIGSWRLYFVTGTRKVRKHGGIQLGKGFYLPAIGSAQISFSPVSSENDQLVIANQVQLGQLRLKLTGPARYLGKKNLMAFDFTQIQVNLGAWTVYQGSMRSGKESAAAFAQQAIAKLPFFAFFLVTDQFIAARGRGGGLALWVAANHPNAD
jgi:hypothetical protein